MRPAFWRCAAQFASLVAMAAALSGGAGYLTAQQSAPAALKLPDILDLLRPAMSPQDTYNAMRSIDVQHQVAVSQVLIPDLFGNNPVVYAMQPATANDEFIYAFFTMPPNPQQVWQVHRQLNGGDLVHSTLDNLVASLRHKYGREVTPAPLGATQFSMDWVFDEQGRPANNARPPMVMKNCLLSGGLQPAAIPVPLGPALPPNGVLPAPITNAAINPGALLNPATNPCQGLVWAHASITGLGVTAVELEITISNYGLQNRAVFALKDVLSAKSKLQQTRELKQAQQHPAPKL